MKLWVLLLALWMILYGLLSVSNFQFDASRIIMGLMAIAIGILIFVQERTNLTGS